MTGATGAAGSISTGAAGTPAGAAGTRGDDVTGTGGLGPSVTGAAGMVTAPGQKGEEIVGHGCGCETGGSTPVSSGAGATILLALAFVRRRRAPARP
jgi:MYXO-CTERM domain-containing protein